MKIQVPYLIFSNGSLESRLWICRSKFKAFQIILIAKLYEQHPIWQNRISKQLLRQEQKMNSMLNEHVLEIIHGGDTGDPEPRRDIKKCGILMHRQKHSKNV